MKCPNCSIPNCFSTLDTRANSEGVLRRRKCKKCDCVFWSKEEFFSYDKPNKKYKANNKTPVILKPKVKTTAVKKSKITTKHKSQKRKRTHLSDEIDSIFQEIEEHNTTDEEREIISNLGLN